jgi:septal ring factor EnvC (AmiA/AmiB activator)
MIPLASALDASAIAALGTLAVAIVGAVVGYAKVKPEAESIATKTTLEVNEDLRQERAEARKEAAELRVQLREREEEVGHLQLKLSAMREQANGLQRQIDTLEAEVEAMRSKTAAAREGREKS